MVKLGKMPKQVIQQLDKQAKLSFLSVNETMRLLDCILGYVTKHIEEYPTYASVIDKLYNNLVIKNDKMNEPKLTQAMEFFVKSLTILQRNDSERFFAPNVIDKRMLQYRAQILIDRFTEIMGDDEFSHTIQLSARAVKEISRMLDEIQAGDKEYKPLTIKSFLDKGLRLAKYDIMQMKP